jgi:hypothetical protein
MIELETSVPIPEYRGFLAPSGEVKQTLEMMQIGESFWVPYRKSAAANAHTIAQRLALKVTTRSMMKDGRRGVRIWRVA